VGHWWFIPVTLATWKAKIGRIMIWDQPGQILCKTPYLQNNQSKIDWRCGSSSMALALQVWSPEFKTPVPLKKKKILSRRPISEHCHLFLSSLSYTQGGPTLEALSIRLLWCEGRIMSLCCEEELLEPPKKYSKLKSLFSNLQGEVIRLSIYYFPWFLYINS
jgi:hypothetical protein